MRIIFILLFLSLSLSSFAQEVEEKHPCAWFQQLLNTDDRTSQLKILKKYYMEYTAIPKGDPCRILFIGNLDDQYIMLSRNTHFYQPYQDLFISELREDDIEELNILDRKPAQTLWGAEGAVVFSSTSTSYRKRMDSIYKLRNKN